MAGKRSDPKDSSRRRRSKSRSRERGKSKKVSFAKKDTCPMKVRRECTIIEAGTSAKVDELEVPSPAPFLLNEDGLDYLKNSYGIGVSVLQAMGWKAGSGIGRRSEGALEPVSVQTFESAAVRRGRKDRRCIGVAPPKRFIDSDASESGASHSCSRSKRSSSSKSSSRASGRRKRRKRRRKRRRSSSSSSKSSSRSSSSDDSRKRRRRKLRRARMRATQSPPKAKPASGADAGKSGTAGPGSAGAAPGAAGAAGPAVPVPQAPVNEPPEIAHAKKQVLAKLTMLKNVEPKEQRAKQFRELLRQWHPDKNPERIEMATAVFQFLQKGKSLLSLGSAVK